jgi:hypothetical protein
MHKAVMSASRRAMLQAALVDASRSLLVIHQGLVAKLTSLAVP